MAVEEKKERKIKRHTTSFNELCAKINTGREEEVKKLLQKILFQAQRCLIPLKRMFFMWRWLAVLFTFGRIRRKWEVAAYEAEQERWRKASLFYWAAIGAARDKFVRGDLELADIRQNDICKTIIRTTVEWILLDLDERTGLREHINLIRIKRYLAQSSINFEKIVSAENLATMRREIAKRKEKTTPPPSLSGRDLSLAALKAEHPAKVKVPESDPH